jgi:hypothetical protein
MTVKTKAKAIQLPDWVDPEAWDGWLEMRFEKRIPTTDRAQRLALNKLVEFLELGMNITKIIDASTEQGWTTFYAEKGWSKEVNGNDVFAQAEAAIADRERIRQTH